MKYIVKRRETASFLFGEYMHRDYMKRQRAILVDTLNRVLDQIKIKSNCADHFLKSEQIAKVRRYGKKRFRELYIFNKYGNLCGHMNAYRLLESEEGELDLLKHTFEEKIREIDQYLLSLLDEPDI
jgi:hypothetical protein